MGSHHQHVRRQGCIPAHLAASIMEAWREAIPSVDARASGDSTAVVDFTAVVDLTVVVDAGR